MRDHVPIGEPKRKRVAASIGMACENQVRRIEEVAAADLGQSLIDAFAIGAVAANHEIPGREHRLGRQQQEASRLGMSLKHRQNLLCAAAAAMEQHHERRRPAWIDTLRYRKDRISLGEQAQGMATGGKRILRRKPVRECEPTGESRIDHARPLGIGSNRMGGIRQLALSA